MFTINVPATKQGGKYQFLPNYSLKLLINVLIQQKRATQYILYGKKVCYTYFQIILLYITQSCLPNSLCAWQPGCQLPSFNEVCASQIQNTVQEYCENWNSTYILPQFIKVYNNIVETGMWNYFIILPNSTYFLPYSTRL